MGRAYYGVIYIQKYLNFYIIWQLTHAHQIVSKIFLCKLINK